MNRIEREHLRLAIGNSSYRQVRLLEIAMATVALAGVVWSLAKLIIWMRGML